MLEKTLSQEERAGPCCKGVLASHPDPLHSSSDAFYCTRKTPNTLPLIVSGGDARCRAAINFDDGAWGPWQFPVPVVVQRCSSRDRGLNLA